MGSERLAESSHLNFDVVGNAFVIRQSPALPTDHSDGVGFIEEDPCTVAFLQLHDFAQRSAVAVHTVDRLGNDQFFPVRMFGRGPLQVALEFSKIVVRKDTQHRTAQAGRIHQAGMRKLVENDDIPRPAERGDCAHGRRIAAREGKGGFCLLEFRNGVIEFLMRGECATDQAG